MADWSLVTKENLRNSKFLEYNNYIDPSYKLTEQDKRAIKKFCSDNDNKLRRELANYLFKAAQKSQASNVAVFISVKCNMSESSIRKVLKGDRNITKEFVGNVCVGLNLSISESAKLFELMGQPLNFNSCYFDAVTMAAIKDNDSIDDYQEELKCFERD